MKRIVRVVLGIWCAVGLFQWCTAASLTQAQIGEKALEAGLTCLERKQDERAFRFFQRAAKAGNAQGMRALGICLSEGIGCWLDTSGGAYWLEQSALHGDCIAAYLLAKRYAQTRQKVKALDMLRRAVEIAVSLGNRQLLVDCSQLALDIGEVEYSKTIFALSQNNPPVEAEPQGGSGTAWQINDTDVVTCWHVIDGMTRFHLWVNGEALPLTVVAGDKEDDLAVLRLPLGRTFPNREALPVSLSTSASKRGSSCFTLGFPQPGLQGRGIKYTEGTVSALEGFMGDEGTFQVSVEIQPGNSGGPLLDSSGRVIGVIVSTLLNGQNVNYAIKKEVLLHFLTSNKIPFPSKSATIQTIPSREALVEKCEKAVYLIECSP